MGAALLAGCGALQPLPEGAPERPARAQIQRFALDGRVAVRGEEGNSFTAQVSWRHDGAGDTILITSPLGQGLAELRGSPAGAELTTADRQTLSAPDLETLGEQVFGARLPLLGMPDWVLGRSGGGAVRSESDAAGRLTRLFENGWDVQYPAYESDAAGALPALVRLRRGEIEVRLKIDQWSLEP